MWVIRRSIVDWDCAKTQTLLGDLEDSKINFGRNLVYLWKSSKKLYVSQTSVSHSFTESEIISLDAGLRLDGLLALNFKGRGDRSVTFIEKYQTTNQSAAGNCSR